MPAKFMTPGQGMDLLSLVPVYVQLARGDEVFAGGATGFFWHTPEQLYFVTNWHVVAGRNPDTNQPLAAHGGIPDNLRISVPQGDRSAAPHIHIIPTLDLDEEPLWFEHPVLGKDVDVAVLPTTKPSAPDTIIAPANLIPYAPLKQRVGMSLFILGYPFERTGHGFPVWKQGSFASEPVLSPDHQTFLLVDTASRPGMSGSPVIQRVHGEVQFEDGTSGHIHNGDGAARFVGIYSGRLHTNNPLDAQLGRVWPTVLVEEIIKSAITFQQS